jgi:hypothetical protein
MPYVSSAAKSMTVAQALDGDAWVAAIRGAPSVPAIVEFMLTWERVQQVVLGEAPDTVTWKFSASGTYTAKSAYQAFFLGRVRAMEATDLWSAGAPLQHKLHMWFAMKNRLWAADRLERRGLEHPEECPLCCQESETTSHLTLQCSFSRQVWYNILIQWRLHRFTPTAKSEIATWWSSLSEAVPKKHRKEVNALIILVARSMAGEKQQGLRQICYPAHGTLLQNQG